MFPLLLTFLTVAQLTGDDTTAVARVGRFAITADELLTSYEFGPGFVKRRPNPLRRHLQYMIDERLLALDAEQLGYDTTGFVRDRVAGLAEDLAVEQLYREVILSGVHPAEQQLARDMRFANTTVAFRWIHVGTMDEALGVERALRAGASFDSLFSCQSDTASGSDSRSLETTVLRLERDNPAVASVIERMHVGRTSEPVRGPDGIYLFHIDRFEQNPVITETEQTKLRNEAVSIRTALIADSLADRYVKLKMKEANPILKADGFNIARALIADRGLSKDTKIQWSIPSTFWTEAGPQPISASGTMVDRTLVTFGKKAFTVRDYTRWYDVRQFQLDTRSLAAFTSSVKKTIWKMVQDKLLSDEAASRAMFSKDEVVRHSEEWDAKILYLAGRSHALRSIRITDDDLQRRFKKERQRFRDRTGKVASFKVSRDALWTEEYAEREVSTLRSSLAELRKRIPSWIDELKLRELSVGIRPEPRPLEAIFYKPGGTFPRVAFPSIDASWERMP